MKNILVKDLMTRDVITIAPDTSLAEAHHLMKSYGVRRLPVVDRGELIGIVTRGDIRGAEPSTATTLSIWEINYLLAKTTVRDIMTPRPLTVQQSATVREAAKLMLDKKISGLPVLDMAGNVIGIVTESDIFRMIAQMWQPAETEALPGLEMEFAPA
jgi:acetoin utilization protein AcuB